MNGFFLPKTSQHE